MRNYSKGCWTADISQLNLPHRTKQKREKKKNYKVKSGYAQEEKHTTRTSWKSTKYCIVSRTLGFQTERFLHCFLLLLIEKGASSSSSVNKISACIISTSAHNTHTHTRFMAFCPQLPRWTSNRKVNPICILLKQEMVSDNGISWAVCKSAPCSRQRTTPVPHQWVFFTSRKPFLPLNQQWRSTKDFHLHITSKI